jgi:hypothetical protein
MDAVLRRSFSALCRSESERSPAIIAPFSAAECFTIRRNSPWKDIRNE